MITISDLRCSIWLALAAAMLVSFGQNVVHGSESITSPSSDVAPALTLVRQVGKLRSQRGPSVDEAKELATKLGKAVEQAKGDFREALTLYQAAALVVADQLDEAAKVLANVKSAPDKPEFLLLKMRLITEQDPRERGRQCRVITHEYGSLFPISMWGRDRDSYLSPSIPFISPPPPRVPKPYPFALLEIADLFDKMGQRKDAINAYLQGIYSLLGNLDKHVGRAWLRVAALERQEGHPSLALRAYLRAAAASDETLEPAQKGLLELETGTKPMESVPTQTPDIKKSLQRIMALYRKMNLHPLALGLAAQWKEKGVDLSAEVKTIKEEWQEIVNKLVARKRKYTIGLKMSEVKDWSKATISLPTETFWIPTKAGK